MSYQKPLTYTDLISDDTEILSLLSIVFAGRVFYWASRGLVIESTEHGPIQFEGGLSIDWKDALALFNNSPPLVSVSMGLFFPVDVAALIAKGHDLGRATGEFSIYAIDPTKAPPTYEQRIVVFSGQVVDPEYGAHGEPVTLSLESNPFEDRTLIPSSTQRINSATFPVITENIGEYYPIVFGTPGVYEDTAGLLVSTTGSPAFCVFLATNKILIAGHEVAAANVSIYNTTSGAVDVGVAVSTDTDDLGQLYSYVTIGAYAASDVLWCVWNEPTGQPEGGLLNDQRNGTRTGAGELLTYFFRLSTIEQDRGRWRAVSDYLDQRFKFSGYINKPCRPWDYIQQNMIPLLPLSLIATSDGLAPVIWRRDASKAQAVGHLTAGPNLSRVGPVSYYNQEITNEIRLNFGVNGQNDFAREMTLFGGEIPEVTIGGLDPTLTPDYFSTEYSRASFLRYGTNAETLDTDIVLDNATATEILEWKHRAACFPYRTITYDAAIRYGFLRRGDVVLLSDPELHITEHVAFVRDLEWYNGRPSLTFVLVDNPPREDR